MLWAKQSTAKTLTVGPILDAAGNEYGSAVIGDLSISKNGGTLTALASAATLTYIANGMYTLVLTTGNLDTLGTAEISCNKTGYQMRQKEIMVLPATVYDALVTNAAGGANGFVLSDANNRVTPYTVVSTGTCQSGNSGSLQVTLAAGAPSYSLVGHRFVPTGGTGGGQPAATITSYNTSTKVVTLVMTGVTWTSWPDGTTTYAIESAAAVVTDRSQYSLTSGTYTLIATNVWSVTMTTLQALTSGFIGRYLADWLSGSTPQTGDSYTRLGNPAGASVSADIAAVKSDTGTLTSRLSSARAGYLDNLNVSGNVASHADIVALNQSASRRLVLSTVQQYERPENISSNNDYQIELRTYDGDGAPVDATSDPTLTTAGIAGDDLSSALWNYTHVSTGLYRWNYAVTSTAVVEQIRHDVSVTMSDGSFTLSCYAQICDLVGITFTTADRDKIEATYNKLPSKPYLAGTNNSDGDIQLDEATGTADVNTQYIGGTAQSSGTDVAYVASRVNTQLPPSGQIATQASVDALPEAVRDVDNQNPAADSLGNDIKSIKVNGVPTSSLATLAQTQIKNAVDTQLSATHGDGSWEGGGGGGGSYTITIPTALAENGVYADVIPAIRGDSLSIAIDLGVSNVTDHDPDNTFFTIKSRLSDTSADDDSDAFIQVQASNGLIRYNSQGTSVEEQSYAALSINESTGIATLTMEPALTRRFLARNNRRYVYDFQVKSPAGTKTPRTGEFRLIDDVTRR